MKNIINDFVIFIKSLSFLDILFILAIIGLLILIVSLIYIIKMNDEDELDYLDEEYEEEQEYINKIIKEDKEKEEKEEEELDLASIKEELENSETKPITLNDYEKEQEEKAIISYDELLKTKDLKEDISYIKEQNIGGLSIKSVDVDQVTRPIDLPKIKKEYEKIVDLDEEEIVKEEPQNILLSYEKEEEFLSTLKKLQKLLN